METETDKTFDSFVVLELMGHRQLAGRLTEQQIAGKGFLRIDFVSDGKEQTQLYSPDAVYAIHPVSEEVVKRFTASQHVPVSPYDLNVDDLVERRVQQEIRRLEHSSGDDDDEIDF